MALICFGAGYSLAQSLPEMAEAGNWDAVEQMFDNGTDVNATQADGMTALHWAAYRNKATIVKALIEAGADPNVETIYSVTPISLAAERGDAETVEVLVEAGADVEKNRLGKETPLMLAARQGDANTLKVLLTAGARVDAKEAKGQTALMWAAAAGNVEVVDALLEAGAEFEYSLKKSNFSAFMFACRNGRIDVAMRLLEAGYDVNSVIEPKNTGGRNPRNKMSGLMLAIESGHLELALELVGKGADPNDQRSGFAPLHAISWVRKTKRGDNADGDPAPRITGKYNTLEFVREIVAAGADVNLQLKSGKAGRARLNKKGATPFLMASATADLPLMQLLLDLKADPLTTNIDGCNALMAASGVGVTAVGEEPGTEAEVEAAIRLLHKLGLDIDQVDKNGETAMHGAAYRTFPKIVTLLSELGATPKKWDHKNKYGWTPRMIATGKRPGSVKPSPETIAAIDEALKKNVGLD